MKFSPLGAQQGTPEPGQSFSHHVNVSNVKEYEDGGTAAVSLHGLKTTTAGSICLCIDEWPCIEKLHRGSL